MMGHRARERNQHWKLCPLELNKSHVQKTWDNDENQDFPREKGQTTCPQQHKMQISDRGRCKQLCLCQYGLRANRKELALSEELALSGLMWQGHGDLWSLKMASAVGEIHTFLVSCRNAF